MISSLDQLNRSIILNHYPIRIVSLVPSQTELLFDLGLRDEVVGITKFCIHPEEWFRSKIRVGGTKKLDIEKIKSLKPDLIIANKEENDESQINLLTQDFPVWISDIKNLGDALKMIEEISVIVNRKESGSNIVRKITNEFKALACENLKTISCAYLIWKNPMMIAGGDTFISEMLLFAGFKNVFEKTNRYPQIQLEDLQRENPNILLLSSEPFPFREKHLNEFRKELPFVRPFLVDGEIFSWYGSRLLKAPSYFKQLRQKIDSAL